MFGTALVADRGEIARRVIRPRDRLGIGSVAVDTPSDRRAPFVRDADRAVEISSYRRGGRARWVRRAERSRPPLGGPLGDNPHGVVVIYQNHLGVFDGRGCPAPPTTPSRPHPAARLGRLLRAGAGAGARRPRR
jgi:carbamoyl-phosphate synthase L subunit-like protein